MAWKMTRAQQFSAIGVALLLLVPPFPSRVSSDFVLEPGNEAHVRAKVAGKVAKVFLRQGDEVKAGQTLAVIENPEVTADTGRLAQQLALAKGELRTAQERPESRDPGAALREEKRLEQEFAVAENKAQELTIRAPHDGIIKTRNVEQKVGGYLAAGDEFCQIVNRNTMKARVLVRDWELNDIRTGARVRLKVLPFPYRTYSGNVEQILPAAAADQPVAAPQKLERLGQQLTSYFAVVVEFANDDGSLREGMTGTAKISSGYSPAAWKAGRELWRWVRSQVW